MKVINSSDDFQNKKNLKKGSGGKSSMAVTTYTLLVNNLKSILIW
jgi:hypothetical protein